MTNLLIRLFVPRAERASEQTIRLRYGQLAGIVGIAANVLLCLVKLLAGIVTHSISVMADAVNNLTDALSSVISLISFHLSGKEPDKEHPFGYGRTEYIAGLFVSMLIIFVGFQFIKSSADRILLSCSRGAAFCCLSCPCSSSCGSACLTAASAKPLIPLY